VKARADPRAAMPAPSDTADAQPPRQQPAQASHGQPRLASGEDSPPATGLRTSSVLGVHSGRQPSLLRLAARLQPRDYALALLLDDHRVLTTNQITAALFTSPRTCTNRLNTLRRLGFIDRFTTSRHGTCWVPGLLSARYAALHRGDNPPTAAAVRQAQDATLASPVLAHTLGTNQFFIDLIAHSRNHPGTRLIRWWPARRAAAAVSQRIHPDGYGIWSTADRTVSFWLEYDTGTEPLTRLIAKLGAYARLADAGGPAYPVLFSLPSTRREANLHKRLPPDTLAASTSRDLRHHPAGRAWQTACGQERLALAELPLPHAPPGPFHPPPTRPPDRPISCLIPSD
jgi:Replication-relaxation